MKHPVLMQSSCLSMHNMHNMLSKTFLDYFQRTYQIHNYNTHHIKN